MRPAATKGNKKRDTVSWETSWDKKEDKLGNKGDKAAERQIYHPRQGRTRPRESRHTIHDRHTCGATMRDKADTLSNTGPRVGRQGETIGDNERQKVGKADTPQRETTREIGGNGKQGETMRETRGEKTSGRRTQHPTQAHVGTQYMGDHRRQWETRARECKHTIQQRELKGRVEIMGDNWGQGLGEGGHTIHETGTMGVKTLGKADTPSKKGVQWESRPSGRRTHHQDPPEGGHTIHERGTMGVKTLEEPDTPSRPS